MEWMKRAFAPEGAPPLKPVDLMAKLFDIADVHLASQTGPTHTSTSAAPATAAQHFLPFAGIFIYLL